MLEAVMRALASFIADRRLGSRPSRTRGAVLLLVAAALILLPWHGAPALADTHHTAQHADTLAARDDAGNRSALAPFADAGLRADAAHHHGAAPHAALSHGVLCHTVFGLVAAFLTPFVQTKTRTLAEQWSLPFEQGPRAAPKPPKRSA